MRRPVLSGHQPVYLPSLHLLHKIARSDRFVLVEEVAFNDKSWQNRNRIRSRGGWVWLTVPVLTRGRRHQKISEVEINPRVPWARKHLRSIELLYGRSPWFPRYEPALSAIYGRHWRRLTELNRAVLDFFLEALALPRAYYVDSELARRGARIDGKGTERVLQLCDTLGAGTYLSSAGERAYHDEAAFEARGVAHWYQRYETPRYEQRFEDFEPNLSALDALLCIGPRETRRLLESGEVVEADASGDNDGHAETDRSAPESERSIPRRRARTRAPLQRAAAGGRRQR